MGNTGALEGACRQRVGITRLNIHLNICVNNVRATFVIVLGRTHNVNFVDAGFEPHLVARMIGASGTNSACITPNSTDRICTLVPSARISRTRLRVGDAEYFCGRL